MKKVCWIGPVIPDKELPRFPVHSPASNLWQHNFIQSLWKSGYECTVLSYVPHRTWPYGSLWCKAEQFDALDDRTRVVYHSYLNIKGIREIWLTISSIIHILINRYEVYDYTFTYNPLICHRYVALFMKYFGFTKKWISVMADFYVKGKPDINVFLSYAYYNQYQSNTKYLFEGGTSNSGSYFTEPKQNEPYIVYAGTKSDITGIRQFVEAYNKIEDVKYELRIYGPGIDSVIDNIATHNSKIRVYNFVSSEDLDKACSLASAFIAPRGDTKLAMTTFPSKLLYYLKYEKPILSAINPAIDPKYFPFLIFFENASPLDIQIALDRLSQQNLKRLSGIIKLFFDQNMWDSKVAKLMSSIESMK